MEDYERRVARCTDLMKENGFDALVLTKPANMYYLTGDGRLCAYAMITREGKVAMGVPQTDIDDVKKNARADFVAGFDDEVGLIHSVAHFFKHFGIQNGRVGLEYAFLPQPRLNMFTHPHAKPAAIEAKDCTPLMSALRLVKEDEEISRMKKAAEVAAVGMGAALATLRPGVTENDVASAANYAMRQAGATDFYRSYVASGERTNVAHGPPIHGIGIEFEEAPLPAGHAFFHGEKAPLPLLRNVVIAVGNCGLYTGPWGIREEDTVAVGVDGPVPLTGFPRNLTLEDK